MGHKVHPYGFRLGVSRTWTAKWYADDKEYTASLKEDIAIRQLIERRLANASVSGVEIERGINHVTVTIHTAKPGIVIGKGGANVEILRQQIGALTNRKVKLEIKEIRQPELDAYLVAMNIAGQLSRRIAFKKAMKQAIQRSMKAGAKGVKIAVAGRLGGSEMGRREWDTRRSHPARHASRGHQLRPGPRPHDLRPDRRQGLDLPRRHRAGADAPARGPGGPGRRSAQGSDHVDAATRQASQGHARPHVRRRQGRPHGRLRRLRPGDPGAGLDHQPPDRGRPARDDPLGQARRQDLDPDLPGQARHEEAGRDPDGLRQGRARPLGRGRQAGPDPLRDGRRRARAEAVEAMRLASHKLPVATRVVVRDGAKEADDGHR